MLQPGSSESPPLRFIRRAVLGIVALGIVGISVELLFINHHEDATQVIPLGLAGVALITIVWTAVKPGVASLRALQFVMLAFIGAGITGITLHFQANAEFQRDIDPELGGLALVWKVVEATAPPALAPGVMVQLGLLGLVYTYRHPALRDEFDEATRGD